MEQLQQEIPAGYMKNSQGHLVPLDRVSEIDKQRDALVKEIAAEAEQLSKLITAFKTKVMGDIQAFVDLSAEKHGIKIGGPKGNVNLFSYDGGLKVTRAIDEYIVFNETLQIAKQLIDQCIHSWSEGSDSKIRVLVNDAFQVEKTGHVNIKRILSLRRLEIADPTWQKAMEAIGESIQVNGSKTYMRIYRRLDNGEFSQIALNVSK